MYVHLENEEAVAVPVVTDIKGLTFLSYVKTYIDACVYFVCV